MEALFGQYLFALYKPIVHDLFIYDPLYIKLIKAICGCNKWMKIHMSRDKISINSLDEKETTDCKPGAV
jgi:hypothetical protein